MVQVQLSEVSACLPQSDEEASVNSFSLVLIKKRASYPYPYGSIIKEYMQWNMIEDDPSDGIDKIIAYSNHRWKGMEAMNMKVIPRVYLVWVETMAWWAPQRS